MRRLPRPLLALAITMVAAPLWGSPLPAAPPSAGLEVLSGVDFVPQRDQLDLAFAGNIAALVGLANDDDSGDPGIRLRAYHSLGKYDGDAVALTGLRAAITRYRNVRSGTELLYLIAALDALGAIGDDSDVALVAPLLVAGDSRDLRAAAARALGGLGSAACAPLQSRAGIGVEPVAMVRIAINRALNRLGPALCQGSP